MKRTFIGFNIDNDHSVLRLFLDLKMNLKEEQLKWIEPDNLHLTLRFLGDTNDSQLSEIVKSMKILIPHYKYFLLKITGLGIFGTSRLPKILWAGVKMPDSIKDMVVKIEEIVCNAGFKPEKRAYTPHLTLCRLKSIPDSSRLENLLIKYKQTLFIEQEIRQITFYESILHPSGPVYKPLHIFPLSGT